MAIPGEVVLRQRVCRGGECHAVFWICRHCDRGQRYCSPTCRAQARLQQRRCANCRHQRSPEGRLDHRDRQREYRHRQARSRVTDQGSLSSLFPASCGCGTSGSTRIPGAAATGTHRWPEKRPASWLRCFLCGRSGYCLDPFSLRGTRATFSIRNYSDTRGSPASPKSVIPGPNPGSHDEGLSTYDFHERCSGTAESFLEGSLGAEAIRS
jgi:hypothetical protein